MRVSILLFIGGCATGGDLDNVETARDSATVERPDTARSDSGSDESAVADSEVVDSEELDTAVAETWAADTAAETTVPDTAVADTLMPADAACGPTAVTGAGTCAAGMPVSLDLACTQTFVGDTCSGAMVSNSCGAGQAQIFPLSISSGAKIYAIKVSTGFSLASIPGPPFCGGAGTCAGAGMSTGVSAGGKQWWTVTKTGGGCGPYTLTITPS